MGIFTLFTSSPYTFLKVKQEAEGNIVDTEYQAAGVFQLRGGMSSGDNVETPTADATIWIRPTESFVAELDSNLVGHGIRVGRGSDTQDYRIVGQVQGYDHDLGYIDNYTLDLKKESFAAWDDSELPLE